MTNVFERARAIRMNGEPWQNAVQRAGSQLRYEGQVAGAGKKGVKHPNYPKNRKSPTTDDCHFHKKKKSCRTSAKGRRRPEHQAWLKAHPGTSGQKSARDRFTTFAHEAKGCKGKACAADKIKERYSNSKYGRAKASRLARGQAGGAEGSPKARKSSRTAYCNFSPKKGRCHRTNKAREDFPRPQKPATAAQTAARAEFKRVSAGIPKGTPRAQRNAAIKQALSGKRYGPSGGSGGYGGHGGDGYSNTSSTRSSDFTSVSDSTSMSGGSWTSNDSSSLW